MTKHDGWFFLDDGELAILIDALDGLEDDMRHASDSYTDEERIDFGSIYGRIKDEWHKRFPEYR